MKTDPAIENLTDRPRTLKEVASFYGVSQKVVRSWFLRYGLDDLATRRANGRGYYFTIAELRRIADTLGD